MGIVSDWIFSSRDDWVTETPTIDGTPSPVVAPLGALYLWSPASTLSMLDQVVAAMAFAGVVAPEAFITEDRRVRLVSSGVFTVTWGAATFLRDLLGFTGDLAGSSAYTAPLRSTLLWSPGKRFTPMRAPLDAHGQPVADISWSTGPAGFATGRTNGANTIVQRFRARHVLKDRYWGSPPVTGPGEFADFWDRELIRIRKFIVIREVAEVAGSDVESDYATKLWLGPYVPDLSDRGFATLPFARSQGFELVECYYDVTVPAVQTAEFT